MGSGVFAAKSAGAFAKEADQYKIYPIPQSVTYGNSSFIMSEDVNVVAEEGIDKYTVNFLKEVLEKNDRTMNLSEDIVSGKTNILLGVKESGGVADTYVADHITRGTADLFEKNDPYLLSADTDSDGNEVIAIVGKDTDCTFYGIATLQMMLSSFNNKEGKILDVQIEDYACVSIPWIYRRILWRMGLCIPCESDAFCKRCEDEQLCLRIKDRCISYIKME